MQRLTRFEREALSSWRTEMALYAVRSDAFAEPRVLSKNSSARQSAVRAVSWVLDTCTWSRVME